MPAQRIAARPPFGQGPTAEAMGALTLLSNGVPMFFMGQEYGETTPFYFGNPRALIPRMMTCRRLGRRLGAGLVSTTNGFA